MRAWTGAHSAATTTAARIQPATGDPVTVSVTAASSTARPPRVTTTTSAASPLRSPRSAGRARRAASTASAITAAVSRANQNSSAVGSPPSALWRAVGSSRVRPGRPSRTSTTVSTASTVAAPTDATSTLVMSRARARASGVGARRTAGAIAPTPSSGTRNPKNTTQLTVCGSSAVPTPAAKSTSPATTGTTRRRSGLPAISAGTSSSAPANAAPATPCSRIWWASPMSIPVVSRTASVAECACRLNAPAEPTMASASRRPDQERPPKRSRTTATTRLTALAR